MNNIFKQNNFFSLLTIFSAISYIVHSNVKTQFFLSHEIPLVSIYLFNYFAVSAFLFSSRLNILFQLSNPLSFFILLTFIKMLATIIFFLYFNIYSDYNIIKVVLHFFPVYFLFLVIEIIILKKTFNNI